MIYLNPCGKTMRRFLAGIWPCRLPSPSLHVGFQETIKRTHDGAIGEVVAAQSMFLRGPYRVSNCEPELTETQYQFYNWYHFRWLSCDDVPQSLVHNLDRISWIMKEEMPKWCFGLGGRSASFGEVYGDMFDHYMAKSTMVGVMGQIACYTGQPVTWDEACKSDLQYGPPPEQSTFDTPPPVKPDTTGNYPQPMPGITKLL